jgi:uncharacterized protein (TIGR03083 family)
MTSAPTTRDTELVDQLDEVWTSMETIGAGLTEEQWKTGTECPGWTVQDNLVHITALEAMSIGKNLPVAELPDDLPHVKNDFGRTNEQWIESRRSWSGADALAEFHAITRERIDGLRALDGAGFGADSWTPQGPGTVRTLLPFRIFDSWVHEQDIRRALAMPGNLDSASAAHALGMMANPMAFVVGKKAGAPDGATVVFSLQGPLARDLVIAVHDGRAKLVDGPAVDPAVVLTLGTETFTRLAAGRIDPGDAIAAGDVTITGDDALGRRIVENLNYLF